MEEQRQIFWPESWRSPIGPPVMADSHWPRVMAVSHWPPSHGGLSLAPQSWRTLIGPPVIADSYWPPSHSGLSLAPESVLPPALIGPGDEGTSAALLREFHRHRSKKGTIES